MQIDMRGVVAPGTLLVANHISWLDIPVIGAQGNIAFLSKAEVRDWALIGWMAQLAGTLFIARGAHQTAGTVANIVERLRSGQGVVIFPEGTTTDGTRLERFHPRLFAAAQHAGVRIQPLVLRYGEDGVRDRVAPFIGEETLIAHLFRLLRHPALRARVDVLPEVMNNEGLDRRRLAELCQRAIATTLGVSMATMARRAGLSRPQDLAGAGGHLGGAT
jgi:1-acyl-sn-glycerol-3-phosphate acyltransferase